MKKSTLGALIILILGVAMVFIWKLLTPVMFERGQLETSDARDSATVRIGGDGYLGYWFITSPEMRKQLARRGLTIAFTDDGGAYAERLRKFAKGEYDAIVLPVNSYLEHAAPYHFPGVIVAAIAESKGADGIVGFADRFPGRTISDLNDDSLQIVYTEGSPSSFLLDLIIVDFDLFRLSMSDLWRVKVGGSREVLKRAEQHQGDAFVMWEPELSRALSEVPGLTYLWGSDKFEGYIKDVFVFHRDFLKRNQSDVLKFFESYFMVMRSYAGNRDRMLADIKTSTGLKPELAKAILDKIDWYDLHENAGTQFGVQMSVGVPASEGVVNTIIAVTDVLLRTKKLSEDPLGGNPYLITNSSILEKLLQTLPAALGRSGSAAIDFAPLSDKQWGKLREIGSMRVEPITFQTGRNLLDTAGKERVDKMASMLVNNYPTYRVAVRGHTGAGNEEQNQQLSRERAQVVVQRLIAVHNADPDRLHAEGMGSSQPPPKKPGESPRRYRYRLPRVEFVLLEDNPL